MAASVIAFAVLSLAGGVSDAPASTCVGENDLSLSRAPQLSGSATVGGTLTTSTGKWNSCSGATITYSYRWVSGDVGIAGASGASYVVAPSDAGYPIYAVVTAHSSAGGIKDANSNTVSIPGEPLTLTVSGPLTNSTVTQDLQPIDVTTSVHPLAMLQTFYDGATDAEQDLDLTGLSTYSGDVGPYDTDPDDEPPGAHTVDVVLADPEGHTVTRHLAFTILDNSAPADQESDDVHAAEVDAYMLVYGGAESDAAAAIDMDGRFEAIDDDLATALGARFGGAWIDPLHRDRTELAVVTPNWRTAEWTGGRPGQVDPRRQRSRRPGRLHARSVLPERHRRRAR